MSKEAMKLALEAIESAIKSGDWKVDGACDPDMAIVALRDALSEQAAQKQIPEQLAKYVAALVSGTHEISSVSIRPKRGWIGLTNKDVYECEPKTDWYDSVEFARAIETKLKEKNT